MLKKINIENLALVEYSEIIFENGFSVLTGETGAGKSVIITALSLALGERAEREYIRYRYKRCIVEVTFDVSKMPQEYKKEFAEYINQNEIIIYREIARDHNSKIKINGKIISLNQLKKITFPLAEILGQHANQTLLNDENHIDFLDNFAQLDDIKKIIAEKYYNWKKTRVELTKIKNKREQLIKEKELLLFQNDEIAKAHITIGEEEQLTREKKLLDSARTLMKSAFIIQDIFDNEENSLISLLSLAQKELDKMSQIDNKLEKKLEELTDIYYRLQDFSSYVEQYGSSIQDDPTRIEDINLRLDEIYNLKKKYGGSEQSILEALKIINKKLSGSPQDVDEYIDELQLKCEKQFKEYSLQALSLTDTRKKAALYLEKLILKELSELAIDKGNFAFELIYEDDPEGVVVNGRAVKPTANGLEKGRILFSANPGEPLKSLVKTASGGEISRVLLALKTAEKKNNKLSHSLLVFDEIDTGIGGQTAIEVGRKLKKLSVDNQLIVITHLHQIARKADHHYVARKVVVKGRRATINVNKLDNDGTEKELERMMALPE